METITIDGMDEHDFRHSIEDMLRLDQIDEAIAKLRVLLEPYAGEGGILPPRFLEVSCDSVEFSGWPRLASRLSYHDRPGHPISAIGVALADARTLGGPGPSGGRLAPFIKTFYFSDDAYPFTDATRDDLLDGYTREGFGWQGDYQASDATLSVKGIDDLHGAIVELEDRLFDSPNPTDEHFRAGAIGACYLAALIHQSLRETIRKQGLPRPLCVLAACDGVYPFFDAPVAGCDECEAEPAAELAPELASALAEDDEEVWPNELEDALPADEDERDDPAAESSLLDMISRKGTKSPVMVLAEGDAEEAARFNDIAEAELIVVDAASGAQRPLLGTHAAHLPAWDGLDPDAGSGVLSALIAGSRSRPLPGAEEAPDDPGDRPSDPLDADALPPMDADVPAIAMPDMAGPDTVGPSDTELVEAEAGPPDLSFMAEPQAVAATGIVTGRGLRNRLNLVQPDARNTARWDIGAIVDRVRRWFLQL